jgi:cation-transporting ATPase E
VAKEAEEGNRVVMLARATDGLDGERLPSGLQPAAILVLGDVLRPDVAETLGYFEEQGVAVKVISGDDPRTVARSRAGSAFGAPTARSMRGTCPTMSPR